MLPEKGSASEALAALSGWLTQSVLFSTKNLYDLPRRSWSQLDPLSNSQKGTQVKQMDLLIEVLTWTPYMGSGKGCGFKSKLRISRTIKSAAFMNIKNQNCFQTSFFIFNYHRNVSINLQENRRRQGRFPMTYTNNFFFPFKIFFLLLLVFVNNRMDQFPK